MISKLLSLFQKKQLVTETPSVVIPEIKYIHSPDIENLETYKPEIYDNFGELFQLMIGPRGSKGEDSFQLIVCTLSWFEENVLEDAGFHTGLHYLFVRSYNYENIMSYLEKYCRSCQGYSWNECAISLSKLGIRWNKRLKRLSQFELSFDFEIDFCWNMIF